MAIAKRAIVNMGLSEMPVPIQRMRRRRRASGDEAVPLLIPILKKYDEMAAIATRV